MYYCNITPGYRSQSAALKLDYIKAEKKYAYGRDANGERKNRREMVSHTQSDNMPAWAKDNPRAYWEAADKYERANGKVYHEVKVALPIELNADQQLALSQDFAERLSKSAGEHRLPYTFSIHAEAHNPHMHIMLSGRGNDGIHRDEKHWFKQANKKQPERGGALKTDLLDKKKWYLKTRIEWERTANFHLAMAGHDVRIDHRSYEERGVGLTPQPKIGRGIDADAIRAECERIVRENGQKIINNPRIAETFLFNRKSVITEYELDKFALTYSADVDQYQAVKSAILKDGGFICLGTADDGKTRYTTKEVWATEKRIVDNAKLLNAILNHVVNDRFLDLARRTRTLTWEQEMAFCHLTKGADISIMVGYAGTGKSYTLGAVRQAYEAQGYNVLGCALAGVAAEGLEEGSGIKSKTVAARLYAFNKGQGLTQNDVLVVDEAAMLGSRQIDQILSHVKQAGAKLILVGDYEQLQSIERGTAFRDIYEETGGVILQVIRRQEKEWQKQATIELQTQRTADALDRYKEAGNITEFASQDEARAKMADDWKEHQVAHGGASDAMMIAYRKADVAALNALGREHMQEMGFVDSKDYVFMTERGERRFAENDRIIFLRNNHEIGIKNGSLGNIESIDGDNVTVRLDKGGRAVFDAASYKHFDHGYALNTHKLQGATKSESFWMPDVMDDRNTTLVAMTRHKKDMKIYLARDRFGDFEAAKARLGRAGSREEEREYMQALKKVAAAKRPPAKAPVTGLNLLEKAKQAVSVIRGLSLPGREIGGREKDVEPIRDQEPRVAGVKVDSKESTSTKAPEKEVFGSFEISDELKDKIRANPKETVALPDREPELVRFYDQQEKLHVQKFEALAPYFEAAIEDYVQDKYSDQLDKYKKELDAYVKRVGVHKKTPWVNRLLKSEFSKQSDVLQAENERLRAKDAKIDADMAVDRKIIIDEFFIDYGGGEKVLTASRWRGSAQTACLNYPEVVARAENLAMADPVTAPVLKKVNGELAQNERRFHAFKIEVGNFKDRCIKGNAMKPGQGKGMLPSKGKDWGIGDF